MPTKRWNVKYGHHQIEVENYWAIGIIFSRHRARLFIDGETADELSDKGLILAGQGSSETILRGKLEDDGVSKVLRATVKSKGLGVGCTIEVDDEKIFSG